MSNRFCLNQSLAEVSVFVAGLLDVVSWFPRPSPRRHSISILILGCWFEARTSFVSESLAGFPSQPSLPTLLHLLRLSKTQAW
ncbi:hypothetical protein VTI74DRAFT_5631 [Chaetomium olivicolor]